MKKEVSSRPPAADSKNKIVIHPGVILQKEYLEPLGLSANRFAKALRVPTNRITAILAAQRGITADTALRLAKALRTSPEFWLRLQQAYDLRCAECVGAASRHGIQPIVPINATHS